MLDTEKLILPLVVILFIISIILISFAIFIFMSNRKLINEFTTTVNNDCSKYKSEMKAQNDTLTKQLLKQLSEQEIASDNITENYSTKNLMSIFIKLRESIKENCVSTMNQIGAARIAIYLFHNGVHSTHGINFFKMSCMCEKVAIGSGIRERMIEHTNIPINLFDEMIEKLTNNNRYIIMNNETTQETNHKIFISADKINYTQLVSIYDINNNMLGFVAVEMDRPFSKDEADREKEILDELVRQLVPVLSYSDYTSIKA